MAAAGNAESSCSTPVRLLATRALTCHCILPSIVRIRCAPVLPLLQLVRRQSQAALLAANRDEARVLEQMLLDPRTFEAVMSAMQAMAAKPKSKL